MRILGYSVACIMLLTCIEGIKSAINSKSYPEYYRVEEYFVEHEVSSAQAKNVVQHLNLEEVEPKAGCQQCTSQEIRYCLGPQLMNDHCCCDRRYNEYFPYVPHTCYIGLKLCKPLAKDCAEYTRLRTCCCDKYVLQKWKAISSGPKNNETLFLVMLLTISIYLL